VGSFHPPSLIAQIHCSRRSCTFLVVTWVSGLWFQA